MLTKEDEALWKAFAKTVTPLSKASRLQVIGQKLSAHFWFKKKEESLFVPTILDLHGFTVQEAYTIFVRFLNKHVELKTPEITVITGRGTDGKGLLKNELPLWLERVDVRDKIMHVTAPVHERGGAFKITLKQRKK